MTEATMRTVPAETSITEDMRTLLDDTRAFYHRNRDVIVIVGAIGISLLISRSIIRRELKRLNFTIDVYPGTGVDEYDFSS